MESNETMTRPGTLRVPGTYVLVILWETLERCYTVL
jgi:hypothetical protein